MDGIHVLPGDRGAATGGVGALLAAPIIVENKG
jgi:phosphoribosylamine-glycine ligase